MRSLALAILATLIVQEEALEPSKIFEKNKNAIVDITADIILEKEIFGKDTFDGPGGSGFFIDKEGHLATAAHVAAKKFTYVTVETANGKEEVKIIGYEYVISHFSKNRKYKAKLLGVDFARDTALLKVLDIDPKDYDAVTLGNSDTLKVGERCYVLGNPYELENSFVGGLVSATHRRHGRSPHYIEDFIQTDAPINSGNSGGPLFDSKGKVVGIANSRFTGGASGIGFAIPINLFNFEQLKKGRAELPWFGAEAMIKNLLRWGGPENPSASDVLDIASLTDIEDVATCTLLAKLTSGDRFAMIIKIDEPIGEEKSPAAIAGLKRGDIITKIDGKSVRNGMEVRTAITEIPIGKEFEIEIIRVENGVAKDITLKCILKKKPQ